MAWLAEAVQHPARRTIVASPVLMSSIGLGEMTPAYAFEAVPNEQQALREMLSSAPETTIVSGDLHASMELQFTDAITEVMAPPLSSSFPPDLAAALDAEAGARGFFARFPASSRRGILEWIKNARRAETRLKRVRETAAKAARNRKANFPPGRDAGPGGEG